VHRPASNAASAFRPQFIKLARGDVTGELCITLLGGLLLNPEDKSTQFLGGEALHFLFEGRQFHEPEINPSSGLAKLGFGSEKAGSAIPPYS
jgi:hypothetical protein